MSVTAKLQKQIAESAKTKNLAFNLADFIVTASTDTARVTLAVPERAQYSEEALAASVTARFNNEVGLVEGSATELASFNGHRFVSALLQRNVVSEEYDANISKMKCIAKDTFMDESDSIWQSVGSGSTRRLVLKAEDDFEALLASRRKVMTSPEMASGVASAPNGCYVMYYSPEDGGMKFGFGFRTEAGFNVLDRRNVETVTIDPLLIVETARNFDEGGKLEVKFANREAEVAFDGSTARKLIEYYRKIYRNTAFFVQLERQIKERKG
jgi:hypothetical protein